MADAMNVRGPCSSCGAPLASDQRYCVECGQRVGPPLALPYALPAPGVEPVGAKGGWMAALPIPIQMASTFAAVALGFGVVIGTAISPNLAGIVAAPSPGVVAEAPPAAPPASTSGGGGGAGAPAGGVAPALAASATPPASFGGGGGGGGGGEGKKKKKKKQPQAAGTTGVVVRTNPVAQSYTIASGGGLIPIHSSSLPEVGQIVEAGMVRLSNGTFEEHGARIGKGVTDEATFSGTVTYCADLEHPNTPCDGSSSTDHYVYTVSALGASVLVSAPHPAATAPPQVGSSVQVGIHIGAAFQPIDPLDSSDWRQDPDCTPAYDEQDGLPDPGVVAKELTQASVNVTAQADNSQLESVVQTECTVGSPRLILSADDVRQSGRDLAPLDVPNGFDLNKLSPGQAVQAAVGIASDGTLTLKGITSDQGVAGADDPTQGQGSLAGT